MTLRTAVKALQEMGYTDKITIYETFEHDGFLYNCPIHKKKHRYAYLLEREVVCSYITSVDSMAFILRDEDRTNN